MHQHRSREAKAGTRSSSLTPPGTGRRRAATGRGILTVCKDAPNTSARQPEVAGNLQRRRAKGGCTRGRTGSEAGQRQTTRSRVERVKASRERKLMEESRGNEREAPAETPPPPPPPSTVNQPPPAAGGFGGGEEVFGWRRLCLRSRSRATVALLSC